MKTIWLVNPYGPIEGENWREYSFNQFGKFLSAEGFRVIWWTANFSHHFKKYRSEDWHDIVVNERFTIRLVPTNAYQKNISFGRFKKDYMFGRNALARFEKEEKPDLIIAAENPMCMGSPSYTYARKNRVPLIYDQMDIWPEFLVRVLPYFARAAVNAMMMPVYWKRKKIYRNLDGAIALGKHYLEFMFSVAAELKNKPNALVYNGIDVQQFRTHLKDGITHPKMTFEKKEHEIWCVFAGTLGPSYDVMGIIECAKRCKQRGYDEYRFIVAGSGPFEPEVVQADQQLENFTYLGKLLPEQLIPIYGKCDIGLSTYSAGSNVDMCDKFYDYTAAGLAVINSLTGEISEHIEQKELGINYTANQADSLMDALLQFRNPAYLAKAKKNSEQAGTEFDMNEQNKKLLQVIKAVWERNK